MITEASEGEYHEVQYREDEIESTKKALLVQGECNSVFLRGKGGVGKSAIAEALAQEIQEKNTGVPWLDNYRMLKLNVASFENAVMQNPEELNDLISWIEQKPTILFIDEFHRLSKKYLQGGSVLDGFYDHIKEAMGRGKLRVMAACTDKEYEMFVSYDEALSSRFTNIDVKELSVEETIDILIEAMPRVQAKANKEIQDEQKHIEILEEACEAAARLTDRAMPYQAHVRKDLVVLAKACSHVSTSETMTINQLSVQKRNLSRELKRLKRARNTNNKSMQERAIRRIKCHLKKYLDAKNKIETGFSLKVSSEDVIEVLRSEGVPENVLREKQTEKVKGLKSFLEENLKGQPQVTGPVCKTIANNYVNKRRNKPIGTFFLAGPSGTGKTEIARLLAQYIYDSHEPEDNIIRVSGAQLLSRTQVIGSPPGYVGYDESQDSLAGKIKKKPYSVVLIDEADKIHPELLRTIFLDVMDNGEFLMANGEVVDCRNCIFLFTSNMCLESGDHLLPPHKFLSELDQRVKQRLSDDGRHPEALGRYDDVLVYNYLRGKDVRDIARLKLSKLAKDWKKNKRINMKFGLETEDDSKEPTDTSHIDKVHIEDKLFQFICPDLLAMQTDILGNFYWLEKDDKDVWLKSVEPSGFERKLFKTRDRVKINIEENITGLHIITNGKSMLKWCIVSTKESGVSFFDPLGRKKKYIECAADEMHAFEDKLYLLDKTTKKILVVDEKGKVLEENEISLENMEDSPECFTISKDSSGTLQLYVINRKEDEEERDSLHIFNLEGENQDPTILTLPEIEEDEAFAYKPDLISVYPNGHMLLLDEDGIYANLVCINTQGEILESSKEIDQAEEINHLFIGQDGTCFVQGKFSQTDGSKKALLISLTYEEVEAIVNKVYVEGYQIETGVRSMESFIARQISDVLTELYENPDAIDSLTEGDEIRFFITEDGQLNYELKKGTYTDIGNKMESENEEESKILHTLDNAVTEGEVTFEDLAILLGEMPEGITSTETFRMREDIEFEPDTSLEAPTNDPEILEEEYVDSILDKINEWFEEVAAEGELDDLEDYILALVNYACTANLNAACRQGYGKKTISKTKYQDIPQKKETEKQLALQIADGKKAEYEKKNITLHLKKEIEEEGNPVLLLKAEFDSAQLSCNSSSFSTAHPGRTKISRCVEF